VTVGSGRAKLQLPVLQYRKERDVSAAAIVRISEPGPAAEEGTPARVLAGAPRTRTRNYYADAGERFYAGIWESTPGKWEVEYGEHEFVQLVAGRVVLTDANGRAERFGPGDSFVIPAGFRGTWETVEAVRKLYVIYQP
jgi:uncharacterized cupin superfamily protein